MTFRGSAAARSKESIDARIGRRCLVSQRLPDRYARQQMRQAERPIRQRDILDRRAELDASSGIAFRDHR